MKRTNVVVDMELLESAKQATGEKTYSATINRALEEFVRVETVKRGVEALRAMGGSGVAAGYLEELRPNAFRPKRASGKELRAPQKKSSRRGSR